MMKVRLTTETINRIRHPKNNHIKDGLRKQLGIPERSSTMWCKLKINEWNGDLTKEAVLQYLEDNLNMTRDQLLETIDD